jgi:hypothetical protein
MEEDDEKVVMPTPGDTGSRREAMEDDEDQEVAKACFFGTKRNDSYRDQRACENAGGTWKSVAGSTGTGTDATEDDDDQEVAKACFFGDVRNDSYRDQPTCEGAGGRWKSVVGSTGTDETEDDEGQKP